MESVMQPENINIFLGALLAISEVIALTPLKYNSIFQLFTGLIRYMGNKQP